MKTAPKNLAASVRDRLKALAVQRRENFDLLLVRYGIERLLYRISASSQKHQFVLKGAMLFTAWEGFQHRETRDLDLMGFGESSIESLVKVFQSVCAADVQADGLEFVSVKGETIRALEEYGGVRLTVIAKLTAARITIQVDVGFGNCITPAPKEISFPTLLDFPAPKLRAYPVETVIAEKLQALVDLGLRNGRLKDYYDLWHLGHKVNFDGQLLARAIRATFTQRKTRFPESDPVGLTARYHDDVLRQSAWIAFGKKLNKKNQPVALPDVVAFLSEFLLPPLNAAASEEIWKESWTAGGPWKAHR